MLRFKNRWCTLFKYTPYEAISQILSQREDLTRQPLSDFHWTAIRAEAEAASHDRESYQHLTQLADVLRAQSAIMPGEDGTLVHLVRLGGVLGSREEVLRVAGMNEARDEVEAAEVKEVEGWSNEAGKGKFVVVDEGAWVKILKWLEGGMKEVGHGKTDA